MKRFWAKAGAVPHSAGFAVELDGKAVRLPGGQTLCIQGPRLAEAVAAEWAQVADQFEIDDLPLTRLASTAQDRIAGHAEPVAMALARYAESDLLCYRAERPVALMQRQHREWQPWLDWAADTFGARLVVTHGISHVPQDSGALAILAGALASRDAETMAGLGVLVPALGSLVLALAVVNGALSAEAAFRLSVLDELFQAEQWGDEPEAAARRAVIAADIDAAARFIQLAAGYGTA